MRLRASGSEQQFWVAEEIAPGAPANTAYQLIQLDGPLDLAALTTAYRAVVHRHEALRTGFVHRDDALYRVVREGTQVAAPVPVAPAATAADIVDALLGAPFDLDAGELIRMAVEPDDRGAILHVVAHHIAYDGLSHELITADLAHAYGEALLGRTVRLPVRPRIPAEPPAERRRAQLVEHWRGVLDGVGDIPGCGAEPRYWELAEARIAERRIVRDPGAVARVHAAARRQRITPSIVLIAAYARAMAEVGGTDDFCVGMPLALRTAERFAEVGCEITMLPVRITRPFDADGTARIWRRQLEAISNADLPFPEIVDAIGGSAGARIPLVQTLAFYQGWERPEHSHGPVRLRSHQASQLGVSVEVQAQLSADIDGSLDVRLQAPLTSGWTGKLDDLALAFGACLDRLSPSESDHAA